VADNITDPSPKGGNPFIPPKDPVELVAWLDRKVSDGRKKLPELRLKMNMAYMLGHQWVIWDENRKQWARPKTNPDDPNAPVRLTINKMGSIVERAVAKLTKENPIPECRPASDDDNDVAAAKVGTRMLTHEMDRVKWGFFLTSFMFWPVTLGWSYAHVAWDPDAGPSLDLDPSGELKQGEIVIEKVPAYEMGADPSATDWDAVGWCSRTVTMTKEGVWERWGEMPDGAESGRTILDEVNDLSNASGVAHDKDNSKGDFVKVHQFWMKPGRRAAPKGMVVTWCGKTILEGPMPFPYDHGKLPFVPCYLLPGFGDAQGRTWVDDLIPMQTDYNDARSREAQLRRTIMPKLMAPIGSIDASRITSRAEIIQYANVNGAPKWDIPDSGWMTQHEQGMTRSDNEMGERSGQNDATQGGAGSSNMPAAAILALQEADDTKLAISAKLLSQFVQNVGWHMLMLIKQYWTEDRIIRTWSEDGDLEAQRFSAADIATVMDVHIEAGSTLPRSRSARTQLAMQLAPLGLIKEPKDLFKLLDLPGGEFLMEHMNLDSKQAQRENSRLRVGVQCQVHGWDNHEVHMTEHNDYRKSQEYDSLPPHIKACVDAHSDMHASLVLQQLAGPGVPGTNQADPGSLPPIAGRPDLAQPPGPQGTQPAGGAPMYVNPATGQPNNPLDVASGQAASPLAGTPSANKVAGIGGPGQPGKVPGASTDSQAASMGR